MKRILLLTLVAGIVLGCSSNSDTPSSNATAPKGTTPPGVGAPPGSAQATK